MMSALPINDLAVEAGGSALVLGGTADVLDLIHDPAVHLALWRRPFPAYLAWIDELVWDVIDDIDERVSCDVLDAAIPRLLRRAGYPDDGRTTLAAEIVLFARKFAQIMDCPALRLRLEVIETDACCKFHADYVKARLLLPLAGPGTQWMFASEGEAAAINELRPGEVGLFKGRLWAEEPAILHRSPPVARTGQSRLLLVLDPVTGLESAEVSVSSCDVRGNGDPSQ